MADNRIRILATLDDKVSSGLARIRDKFDTLGTSKGFQSIVSGVGLGIGMAAWQMASSKIVDVLGDATHAAIEEEASVQKLSTALRANIPAWNGNTDAIEKVLQARMKLGFSDDEQRDSLALLVAATGDVTQALNIQRTAMDLARFKRISLQDATEALTKVEAGSFRILKSLGIELKTGATQTEALAAVQRVAAGQAEDYAKTNSGKLLASQVKVDEAMERLGAKTMPLVVGATEAAADAITVLSTGFDILNSELPPTQDEIATTEKGLIDLSAVLGFLVPTSAAAAAAMRAGMTDAADATGNLGGKAEDDIYGIGHAADDLLPKFDAVGDHAGDMGDDVKRAAGYGIDWMGKFRDAAVSDADALIDQAFDPLITNNKLWTTNVEINAQKRILADKNATTEEMRNAKIALDSLRKDQAELLVTLTEMGNTNTASYKAGIASLKANIAESSGPTKAYLQGVLDKINAINKAAQKVGATIRGWQGHAPGTGPLEFAEGGRVPGPLGMPRAAIVHGGEYVLPVGAGGGTGGSPMTFVYAPQFSSASPAEAQRFSRAVLPELVREMRRQTVL